jgi:hypothetical protein
MLSAASREKAVQRHPLAERQQHNSIEPEPAGTAMDGVDRCSRKQQLRGADRRAGGAAGAAHSIRILSLLQEAHAAGALDDSVIHAAVSAGEDAPIAICEHTLPLDALTDFRRGAGTLGGDDGRGQGDPYSLRSLLLCLACRSLTHSEYCLACLQWEPYTPPVLVLDKEVLFRTLGLGQGASPTGSRRMGCAPQVLEPPPSVDNMVIANAVKARLQSTEHAMVSCKAGQVSDCELQLRSQVESLQRLLQSHEHTRPPPIGTACMDQVVASAHIAREGPG